eukprot:137710_1
MVQRFILCKNKWYQLRFEILWKETEIIIQQNELWKEMKYQISGFLGNTVYGNLVIPSVSTSMHLWTFKVSEMEFCGQIIIGIAQDTKDVEEKWNNHHFFWDRTSSNYSYSNLGAKYNSGDCKDYGIEFKKDAIITMVLHLSSSDFQ